MRRLLFLVISTMALAACQAPVPILPLPPEMAARLSPAPKLPPPPRTTELPEPADQAAGCIGRKVDECIGSVTTVLNVAPRLVDEMNERWQKGDVNGKPLDGPLTLIGEINSDPESRPVDRAQPQYHTPIAVIVTFDLATKIVTSVSATLAGDIADAQTETDYDHTGLYQLMAMLLGGGCPDLNHKLAVYQVFENQIRPTVTMTTKTQALGKTTKETAFKQLSGPAMLCQHKVGYGAEADITTNARRHRATGTSTSLLFVE